MRWWSYRLVVGLVGCALVLTGCGDGDAGSTDDEDAGAADAAEPDDARVLSGQLTVFAAASLTDAFAELAAQLEEGHPDLDVRFNFASSSTLATQLVEGAPADLFASANDPQMAVVVEEGLAGDPATFATNRLAIAVEAGNPQGITRLADLARDDLVLVLPAREVPAGAYAAEALNEAGVEVSPASLEVDVRAALGKVAIGEADAAIVYASDLVSAGDAVDAVQIAAGENVVARYPAAVLDDAPNPEAARAFLDLLVSDPGQRVLEDFGFTMAGAAP